MFNRAKQRNIVLNFSNTGCIMTIEMLKAETTRLTRLERLEFLQFIVALLASEEGIESLAENQKKTLLRRRDEIKSGKAATVSAKTVKANLIRKYGLQS